MKTLKKILVRLFIGIYAAAFLVISLLPFYLMLINSVKSSQDYGRNGFFSLPEKLMFSNYLKVIEDGIFSYFKNSLVVAVISLVLLLFIGLCAAYAFSRIRLKWTNVLFMLVIAEGLFYFHITISIKCKMRSNCLLRAVGNIKIFRSRRPQIIPVKVSLLQYLTCLYVYYRPFRLIYTQ